MKSMQKMSYGLLCFLLVAVSCNTKTETKAETKAETKTETKTETKAIEVFVATGTSKKTKQGVIDIIPVDVSKAHVIDFRKGELITLEVTRNSLLGDISRIGFLPDKMIISSGPGVIAFDNNGKYLFNVGRKGPGPHDYTHMNGFHIKDDTIQIFDNQTRKLISYNANGGYLTSRRIEPTYSLQTVTPLSNGNYLGRSMSHDNRPPVPVFTLFNDNFHELRTIEGRMIPNTFTFYNEIVSQHKDNLLYWEMFNDTIYSVSDYATMAPRYVVDFGRQKFSEAANASTNIVNVIELYYEKYRASVATLVNFVSEDDRYLRFSFEYKPKSVYYVYYDKATRETRVFKFEDSQKKLDPRGLAYYHDGNIYLSVQSLADFDANPSLAVLSDADMGM
jgi:hypothetical protein